MSNIGSSNPLTHPLQAAASAIGAVGGDPRLEQRMKTLMNINEGPANIAAKVTGVQKTGVREDKDPYFTNNEAIPLPDPTHSLNVGGIPVVSDVHLLQKQQTFNRSKTLERMVHPCGSGAFGYFETTRDNSDLTKAHFLGGVGTKTPVAVRFSTVTFGREFPDEGRNPRGFAVKFYTNEGNYDLVGLNWPVFFCRDPMQGPDVIRSQQRNPKNFLLDFNSLFDFLANTPESNHAGMMLFSDHGTPVGWRFNHGYGCHTFKWVNAQGKFVYIKYHLLANHGQKQFTWDEAVRVCGEDPDYSKRDLWDAIERGEPLTWTVKVQVMQPSEADPLKLGFDPFDVTKVWPRAEFPMHEIGKLHLNKNPEDYHRDIEQLAFSPGSMVPGIETSPDALLQFRTFFYRDAQYHRLGVNLHQIPVNCPFMAGSYSSQNFAGPMRVDANTGGNPHYAPSSFVNKYRPDAAETPVAVADNVLSRQSHYFHEGKPSEYDQARELYTRVMTAQRRAHLHANTAQWLKLVAYPDIRRKYLAQCHAIHADYARGIYALLPAQEFSLDEVAETAQSAHLMTKEKRFMPSAPHHRLVGGYPGVETMGMSY